MQGVLEISSEDLETVDLEENPVIEYNSGLKARFSQCWETLFNSKSVEGELTEDSVIEYKSCHYQWFDRSWEWIQNHQIVRDLCLVITGMCSICTGACCVTMMIFTCIYGTSMAIGIGISELVFSSTSLPADPIWAAQYILTPFLGCAVLTAISGACITVPIIASQNKQF